MRKKIEMVQIKKNKKSNTRDTNFIYLVFINCWCDEWILVNEKNDISDELDRN